MKPGIDLNKLVTPGVFACQAALLLVAALNNTHMLNTDAVAYLRLAAYYARGDFDLAVSGYWGPLISWLMALLVKCGVDTTIAARLVMALSAVVFSAGCLAVLRAMNLPRWAVLTGLALAAAASIHWSVENISPDLLLAGWMCFAISAFVSNRWLGTRKGAVMAGVFWGVAYLTKAVAFPLAFLVGLAIGVLWMLTPEASPRQVARQLAITWAVFLAVAAPWMAVISAKYGHATFSTSGRIAHAVVGPPDVERYHPTMRTLHVPDPGRVTSWEDPSRMPYNPWSPFASRAYFLHQLRLIQDNSLTVILFLGSFDLFRLGLVAVMLSIILCVWQRKSLADSRWWWPAAPVALLALIYLPVYVQPMDLRYFYAAYPLLFASGAGVVAWLAARASSLLDLAGRIVLAASFAIPALAGLPEACQGLPNPASVCARYMASRLAQAGTKGPVAGSGFVAGGRTGIYTAYLLDVPWYGDVPKPRARDHLESGATLVVVARRQPVAEELAGSDEFTDLDPVLFPSPGAAAEFPVRVFKRKSPK